MLILLFGAGSNLVMLVGTQHACENGKLNMRIEPSPLLHHLRIPALIRKRKRMMHAHLLRQALIEQNLQRKLAERIEREKEEERRAKVAAAERARRNRPKTQEEIERVRALHARARALAVSRGRTRATLGDYRECNGVPRLVEKMRSSKR